METTTKNQTENQGAIIASLNTLEGHRVANKENSLTLGRAQAEKTFTILNSVLKAKNVKLILLDTLESENNDGFESVIEVNGMTLHAHMFAGSFGTGAYINIEADTEESVSAAEFAFIKHAEGGVIKFTTGGVSYATLEACIDAFGTKIVSLV